MNFPAQRTMLSLTCLSHCAAGYSTSDGRLVAVMGVDGAGRGRAWEVLPAELDELEARGWVSLDPPAEGDAPNTARVRVTDAGRYWLKRWAVKNRRELERGAAAGA
jgi:hypothetical protein